MTILFKSKNTKKKNNSERKINWPTHVETLDKKTFDEFVNAFPLSVVDFWAPWCGPCMAMLPRLRRLERIYQGKVAFGRLNTVNEKSIAEKYNIMNIPYFGLFSYGKKVGSITGEKPISHMKDSIETYISKYYK